MAKGLIVPVGVNALGGAALSEGDDHNTQTLMMALTDDDNNHAWQQDVGIGADMIFDTKDLTIRARILSRVSSIFRGFQRLDLFKLVPGSIAWDDSIEGELTLSLKYINLESDEVKTFSRRFAAKASR